MSVGQFLQQFSNNFSLGVVVAVLVWSLIQGFRRSIFTPLVMAIYPTQANDFEVKLTDDETLRFGEFFADVVHFAFGMIIVYVIWSSYNMSSTESAVWKPFM
jgi:large-conductance mechanosensitive channel